MAGRGTQATFVDSLQGLLGPITELLIAPDADREWVLELLDVVQGKMGQQMADQAASQLEGLAANPESAMLTPPGGTQTSPTMPPTVPPTVGGQSRGPTASPDMSGATAELERVLAGS